MPFNGAGTFTLSSPAAPFVNGTEISATDMNTVQQDIATNGLTNCVTRDGQSPLTANWAVGGFDITGIGALSATSFTVTSFTATTLGATTLTVSGNATVGGTLGVTGAITGSSTISGTAITASTGLTVSAGGAAITGNSTIAGTLGGLTALTMASGLLTVSSSGIRFSDATTQTTANTAYNPTGTASSSGKIVLPINSGAASILVQWGQATTGAGGSVSVTYPTAFSGTPRVSATFSGGTNAYFGSANSIGTTTMELWVHSSAGGGQTGQTVDWIAIGVA